MVYLAELKVFITIRFRIARICALVQFLVMNSLRKREQCNLSVVVNFDQNLIFLWKSHLVKMQTKIYQLWYSFSVEYLCS